MKYSRMDWGTMEAVVNKLGGMDGVRRLLAGEPVVKETECKFRRDMTKEGWTLVDDVTEPSELSIANLELVRLLKDGETHVRGEEMVRRVKKLGYNLGQKHAEYLLEHQDQIPAEWRSYYLIFPGTVWRSSYGSRHVSCLGWYGGRWYLGFDWLEYDWHSRGRLVRPRK